MITSTTSDAAAMETIGKRLARYRLNRNLTQKQLAREAGVSVPTVQRLEAGNSVQLDTLIGVLRALDLLANLEAMVPEPPVSPLQQLELDGKRRQRGTGSRGRKEQSKEDTPWTWGDES